jgi:hypothetical protein
MGAVEEDVMRDWNNIPTPCNGSSFTWMKLVANVHYREYLFWLDRVFQDINY